MIDPTHLSLFYSYAHRDERYRAKLQTHLATLRREGRISEWHDRNITGGSEWKGEIEKQLNGARVILLLVSADFIHSDFCMSVELTRAIERHESVDARVIPIIVRPCDWKTTPFSKLQALPENGKPISKWKPQDDAYVDIVDGIRKVIDEMTGHR